MISAASQDPLRSSEVYTLSIDQSHLVNHSTIHFASFETIVSSVNHEVDRLERDSKREKTRVIVTALGHYKEYYEEHCEERS